MASTVTVLSRLPHDLVLEVGNTKVVINGATKEVIIGSGYGMTENVDADFFAAWLEKFKDRSFVKNELVVAAKTDREAKAKGKDLGDKKSGLEPKEKSEIGEAA